MNRVPIGHAVLDWNEQGTPVSRQFDDVYFSNEDGLEETRYVFLRNNGLPARFLQHPRSSFIVAETGFGTGLNFLALWQAFRRFRQDNQGEVLRHLHYISFEQFPLQVPDLVLSLERWPELAAYAAQLYEFWPPAIAGCHRLILDDGAVTLDLWFGDVNNVLPELDDSLDGQVDAWFLDGFAPAKNPAMWSNRLFQSMARLARPGGTFATFTAAGFVRRGLQQAGFKVDKPPGFGQKREMLVGQLDVPAPRIVGTPWYHRQSPGYPQEVAIIGGGIAGALCAVALQRRGARVTLYCADDAPARGASGNRQGALYPLLNSEDPALTQFFAAAFPFACRSYRDFARRGIRFEHQWCGVTQLAYDARSARKIGEILALGLPEALVRGVESHEVEQLAGLAAGTGGATYPLGGWLNPAQLIAGILEQGQRCGMSIHYGHSVERLEPIVAGWQLRFAHGAIADHAVVVLANGHHMLQWPVTRSLPLTSVRGQVSHIPAVPGLAALKQVLCYDGYLTPASPGHQTHSLGASAVWHDESTDFSPAEQQRNHDRLVACLPHQSWTDSVDIHHRQARCSVRCSARDHMPMVGNVPDHDATLAHYRYLPRLLECGGAISPAPHHANLFMLGALGSRGLCSAPLAAEILAAQIFGEPLPVSRELAAAVSPNRFWMRKLLKGQEI
ncbi:bifunctional tRNA (5-methylaminomethyl-2-thiouridine)(34)-methyltransferase MnmD/FAD-dependent 5-carboxymethylaminomethyl-2-thiouridine(34) oxidoreductase MnmC [Sodalis sp. dw_96]|uniref:bifunctional tRNA (5-methylaminomethyl-2-thiouridine)(34)-methyltransferase MnmD/FAD-dependent 5-carboxymethylaminomethyl-2-thiouridine(34) oxidoreductase MnmC n=1 Tax=Sodalis sp. dw_96 TaxID=2719794 RepID=UPI001BD5AFAE|nr:bifunctional tRNA (5-methylaminomethyl-2-thiouridine)(34)-methyltransferase MnmD/FAD-dependent 5-carboxymethylaminomethyl-2-thiouridine(34) oxidoreductase MnmC [Sodalis sp. dw_96]